jgi:hypothetical protein
MTALDATKVALLAAGCIGLAACGSEPAPVWNTPAPMSAPPVSRPATLGDPAIEQAADDYVDAVVAQAPDALYDMAVKTFTADVDRQTFVAAWTRCNPDKIEHYDVLGWTTEGAQAVVYANADGTRGLFELRLEDGRWRWLPDSKGDCP